MKIIKRSSQHIDENTLLACYDIGKDKLDFFAGYTAENDDVTANDKFDNRYDCIEEHLDQLEQLLEQSGKQKLVVVCEPSGGYEDQLLNAVRNRNIATRYVSGEATCKAKSIESNDNEKSDEKDPRVIDTLAKMKKTLSCVGRIGPYKKLELLNRIYEDESLAGNRAKNHISSCLDKLFPDYSRKRDTLYDRTGRALYRNYGMNPFLIVDDGWDKFVKTMKGSVRQVRMKTLRTFWQDAQSSTRHQELREEAELYTLRFSELYEDYLKHEARKAEYKNLMNAIIVGTDEFAALESAEIGTFMIARIIAETGPIADYESHRCLLRYAGLNLTRRESGKYKGHRKISKKGNALLRKILYQAVFANLIGENQLYHEYFEKKKNETNKGLLAMVAVMRKLLKMIYGVVNSSQTFSRERVFDVIKTAC